jgi:hypothetical protein
MLHTRNCRFSLWIDCEVSLCERAYIDCDIGVERPTAISLVGRDELLSSLLYMIKFLIVAFSRSFIVVPRKTTQDHPIHRVCSCSAV